MANYYGHGRTNFFAVKDADSFREEVSKFQVDIIEDEGDGVKVFALFGNAEEGMPWSYYDEDTDDYIDLDWQQVISKHLLDDWVCVIQEVGNEKLRYLRGTSLAFNNKGGYKLVSLEDVYKESLGTNCHVI
jgi:hypothetical protein